MAKLQINSRTIFSLVDRKKQALWLTLGKEALDKAESQLEVTHNKLTQVQAQLKELDVKFKKLYADHECLLEEYSLIETKLKELTNADTSKTK